MNNTGLTVMPASMRACQAAQAPAEPAGHLHASPFAAEKARQRATRASVQRVPHAAPTPPHPCGSKLNLGLATYGRSWKLLPTACAAAPGLPSPLGSPASGPGAASQCTSGFSEAAAVALCCLVMAVTVALCCPSMAASGPLCCLPARLSTVRCIPQPVAAAGRQAWQAVGAAELGSASSFPVSAQLPASPAPPRRLPRAVLPRCRGGGLLLLV